MTTFQQLTARLNALAAAGEPYPNTTDGRLLSLVAAFRESPPALDTTQHVLINRLLDVVEFPDAVVAGAADSGSSMTLASVYYFGFDGLGGSDVMGSWLDGDGGIESIMLRGVGFANAHANTVLTNTGDVMNGSPIYRFASGWYLWKWANYFGSITQWQIVEASQYGGLENGPSGGGFVNPFVYWQEGMSDDPRGVYNPHGTITGEEPADGPPPPASLTASGFDDDPDANGVYEYQTVHALGACYRNANGWFIFTDYVSSLGAWKWVIGPHMGGGQGVYVTAGVGIPGDAVGSYNRIDDSSPAGSVA